MANEIIGIIYRIGDVESFTTKNGATIQRRKLVLEQKRFDRNTGEEFDPNYPVIDFSQKSINALTGYKEGDKVRVSYDVSGAKYTNKEGKEDFFTTLRGFRIEPYVARPSQSGERVANEPQETKQPTQPVQATQQAQADQPQQGDLSF